MIREVVVFHTNDFHNRLTDALADKIDALRTPDSILVDAGDAIKAGNVGVSPFGEPILARMSRHGWAAMALGNREFHISDLALRHKISMAGFPILCANIRRKDGHNENLPVRKSVVVSVGGLKIGLIGVTVPMVTDRMSAKAISDFVFDDPLDAAADAANTLRPQADLLILLSHAGFKTDQKIAASGAPLDLIVGGHSHTELAAADLSHGTPIVQAGAHAKWLGRARLRQADNGAWTIVESELLALQPQS
jgi:2',3'-cyclic-nucleotide 2'-phosphodiesterase (5'-nucleotidase family)